MNWVRSLTAGVAALTVAMTAALAQPGGDFQAWLEGFRAEAAAAGINANVLDQAFADISINERVYELNENQPEFSRAIWDYLDSAVSDTRIENGRANFAQNRALLEQIETDYGVDAEILVAIWGLESSYGAIMGDHDVIAALATLAYQGRRTGYGRDQLIGALRIIQNGYAERDQLVGSWAGAMGQTQFIPTTYLAYAIDHDGDGKRDIWSNLGDVFASTANYLSASRFSHDEPWGMEVRLPSNFDYALADSKIKKSAVEWTAHGLSAMHGGGLLEGLDPNIRGRLIVPAGAKGPAFLVFGNFEAILKYNRSTAYALAVSLLSERAGGSNRGVIATWPRDDRPLALSERKNLQQALKNAGFDPGPIDGIIGAGTKSALRQWQSANGLPADGYASARILERLQR